MTYRTTDSTYGPYSHRRFKYGRNEPHDNVYRVSNKDLCPSHIPGTVLRPGIGSAKSNAPQYQDLPFRPQNVPPNTSSLIRTFEALEALSMAPKTHTSQPPHLWISGSISSVPTEAQERRNSVSPSLISPDECRSEGAFPFGRGNLDLAIASTSPSYRGSARQSFFQKGSTVHKVNVSGLQKVTPHRIGNRHLEKAAVAQTQNEIGGNKMELVDGSQKKSILTSTAPATKPVSPEHTPRKPISCSPLARVSLPLHSTHRHLVQMSVSQRAESILEPAKKGTLPHNGGCKGLAKISRGWSSNSLGKSMAGDKPKAIYWAERIDEKQYDSRPASIGRGAIRPSNTKLIKGIFEPASLTEKAENTEIPKAKSTISNLKQHGHIAEQPASCTYSPVCNASRVDMLAQGRNKALDTSRIPSALLPNNLGILNASLKSDSQPHPLIIPEIFEIRKREGTQESTQAYARPEETQRNFGDEVKLPGTILDIKTKIGGSGSLKLTSGSNTQAQERLFDDVCKSGHSSSGSKAALSVRGVGDVVNEIQISEFGSKPGIGNVAVREWDVTVACNPAPNQRYIGIRDGSLDGTFGESITKMIVKGAECGLKEPKPRRLADIKRIIGMCREQSIKEGGTAMTFEVRRRGVLR